jgi:hypothetical protein
VAHRQSSSEAGVIGRGQTGRGIAANLLAADVAWLPPAAIGTLLKSRIDELLEAEARKRSGP